MVTGRKTAKQKAFEFLEELVNQYPRAHTPMRRLEIRHQILGLRALGFRLKWDRLHEHAKKWDDEHPPKVEFFEQESNGSAELHA